MTSNLAGAFIIFIFPNIFKCILWSNIVKFKNSKPYLDHNVLLFTFIWTGVPYHLKANVNRMLDHDYTIISGRKDSAKFSICVFIYSIHIIQCKKCQLLHAILSQIIVLEKYDSVERGKKVRCDFHPSGYYS